MQQIILASTSPYRRAQLEQLGVPFDAHPSGVDEAIEKQQATTPDALATTLALQKAEAVSARFPDAIVIAGDQVAAVEGELLNKPGSAEASVKQLQRLSGVSHQLWSAMAVVHGSSLFSEVVLSQHTLTMRELTLDEIQAYVTRDQPWDCVGSYKIETSGIGLFTSIKGDDPSAIVGLPLMALATILRQLGVPLWR